MSLQYRLGYCPPAAKDLLPWIRRLPPCRQPTLSSRLNYLRELVGTAHSTTAEACLSCVNSHQAKALSTAPAPNLQPTPLLISTSSFATPNIVSRISFSAGESTQSKTFQIARNFLRWSYLRTGIAAYIYRNPLGSTETKCLLC